MSGRIGDWRLMIGDCRLLSLVSCPLSLAVAVTVATCLWGAPANAAPVQESAGRQASGILEPSPALPPDQIVEAIAAARRQVAQAPKDPRGYVSLGRALRIAGDPAAATKALDRALALDERQSGAWYEKGLMAIDSGTLPQATDLFQKAVESDPANAPAHLELASLLLRRGDWAAAQAELEAVLRSDPANAGAHDGLGLVLNQQGNPKAAAAEFRRAVELRPAFAEAQESLGETLLQLGDWGEASAVLQQALKGNLEDRSMATYALASTLKHLGQKSDADKEFAQARELMRRRVTEDRAKGENDRGLQLWYAGDLEGAEAALRRAIEEDPDYAEAHNNLGGVLWQGKKTAEAEREFAEAVRLDPGFAKAHNNLGNVLLNGGQVDDAIREFRSAVTEQPGFASAHLNLAIALMKKGENQEAETEIRRTLQLDPDMAEAHLEEGLLLVSQSNRLTPEARKELEAGLHLNPDLRVAIPVPLYEELLLGN
jgi:tetratricopeptide (TPR) repeat protein